MVTYKVGNLIVNSDKALSNNWECFVCDEGAKSEHLISVMGVQKETSISVMGCSQGLTLEHPQFRTTQVDDGWVYEFKATRPSVMRVDKDYTVAQITEGEGEEYLLRLAVECRLIREGFISLHGACVISPDGSAIIFTGNSGVGKSTRAAAWKSALGLKMISGDRPLLDTKARVAYGVPWDGKEGIHVNLNAGISVIFNVIRANENECEITKMSPFDALRVLLAQTFMPMWDTDLAAMAMQNLNRLINSDVLVANLVSGWDEAAARRAWSETLHLSDGCSKRDK